MNEADYLRQQAGKCRQLARDSFDLATAKGLRLMADEFEQRAGGADHGVCLDDRASEIAFRHDEWRRPIWSQIRHPLAGALRRARAGSATTLLVRICSSHLRNQE
jgi:hypothetical protein